MPPTRSLSPFFSAPSGDLQQPHRYCAHAIVVHTQTWQTDKAHSNRIDQDGNRIMEHQQMFSVVPNILFSVKVTVLRARNIDQLLVPASGSIGNPLKEKSPDTYVSLNIFGASTDGYRTKTINNDVNPEWNETFEFFVDKQQVNVLEIVVKDEDVTIDDTLGIQTYDIDLAPSNEETPITITIKDMAEVDLLIYCSPSEQLDEGLRISEDLCSDEQEFVKERKKHVMNGLVAFLGADKGPKSEKQVPTIAILGSGGGFRAMVGFSGVLKALFETGLLDCATYIAGLSGSTWCLSTLYSNPKFPHDYSPAFYQNELKKRIENNPFALFLYNIRDYLTTIETKKQTGQPVSFTDFYGLMLRDTLLKDTPDAKLSDQREKVRSGKVPLPLYTCLHVKDNVQSRVYHEWIEFSPFEAGLAKYGTFMDISNFGSKFYLGRISERFSEYPLHYFQGVWGSAYCIQLRQFLWMLQTDKMDWLTEADKMNTEARAAGWQEIYTPNFRAEFENLTKNAVCFRDDLTKNATSFKDDLTKNAVSIKEDLENRVYNAVQQLPAMPVTGYEENAKYLMNELNNQAKQTFTSISTNYLPTSLWSWAPSMPSMPKQILDLGQKAADLATSINNNSPLSLIANILNDGKTKINDTVDGIKFSQILNSISGRAATIFNHMKGLTLHPTFEEDCVDTTLDDDENFKGLREPIATEDATLYVVDAGLAFNSPYPPLARQQRAVKLYISFDFSDRPKDLTPPFKEILMAEEWARKCGIPFPPVKKIIKEEYAASKEVKEYYLFRDNDNPECPIVIHFVLINNQFRLFKAPGVPRETDEEKEMANFSLFEDKTNPYSSFNFQYTNEQFDRLAGLTEFNTLLGIDLIKQVISELVQQASK